MIITESKQAFDYINQKFNRILLVESQHIKYPPLGLLKLYSFYKYIKGVPYVDMRFGKHVFAHEKYDVILITSGEFSYYKHKLVSIVEFYKREYPGVPIVVGGVYVIANKDIRTQLEDLGCTIIATNINELDNTLYYVDYHMYNWNPWQFIFTSRGCTRKCKFCYVKDIEPTNFVLDSWKQQILAKDVPPYIMIHDNNILSFGEKHFRDVVDTICESRRPVLFNGGYDARYWTEEFNQLNKKLVMRGLTSNESIKFAFDNMTADGKIQTCLKDVAQYVQNMEEVLVYTLINDSPIEEAKYRAAESLKLGARPFIQVYTPLDYTDENPFNFHGKEWTPEVKIVHDYYNYKHYKTCTYDAYLENEKKAGRYEDKTDTV